MGYDLHIHRADDWGRSGECPITPGEWLAVAAGDPDLQLDPANGPYFAVWAGSYRRPGKARFDWADGRVFTKNPDQVTLAKMLLLAKRYGARVQGDDGEFYDTPDDITRGDMDPPVVVESRRPWWRFWRLRGGR